MPTTTSQPWRRDNDYCLLLMLFSLQVFCTQYAPKHFGPTGAGPLGYLSARGRREKGCHSKQCRGRPTPGQDVVRRNPVIPTGYVSMAHDLPSRSVSDTFRTSQLAPEKMAPLETGCALSARAALFPSDLLLVLQRGSTGARDCQALRLALALACSGVGV